MTKRDCDIAIVGGGLAGGLIALALARLRPDVRVMVIESGPAPGGNHRWSWFASDLSHDGSDLMARFATAEWNAGYAVSFPGHTRALPTPYRSLASSDFARTLRGELLPGTLRTACPATAVDAESVTIEGRERIVTGGVIDCRGFAPTRHLAGGWQVFMGRHMRTAEPHGIDRPVIMDASVVQHDGYRFVYSLPLAEDEIFFEDTYYQDTPLLSTPRLSDRLEAYAAEQGWRGNVTGEETGVLPVITGGDFAAWRREIEVPGVALAGARGGFVHPLTSYTLPFAVETALAIAREPDLSGTSLSRMLARRSAEHWRATGFYRRLGAMLFGAARPEERYRIFERFYRLPAPLIERFYAGRSTVADRVRVLSGKPPVPLGGALRALTTSRPALESAA